MITNIKSKTSFKARGRSQSPRRFVKERLLQSDSQSQKQAFAQMCDRQRDSHNALVNHMEQERGRPLNDEEKKILLYFAYRSHKMARTTFIDEYMGLTLINSI